MVMCTSMHIYIYSPTSEGWSSLAREVNGCHKRNANLLV